MDLLSILWKAGSGCVDCKYVKDQDPPTAPVATLPFWSILQNLCLTEKKGNVRGKWVLKVLIK